MWGLSPALLTPETHAGMCALRTGKGKYLHRSWHSLSSTPAARPPPSAVTPSARASGSGSGSATQSGSGSGTSRCAGLARDQARRGTATAPACRPYVLAPPPSACHTHARSRLARPAHTPDSNRSPAVPPWFTRAKPSKPANPPSPKADLEHPDTDDELEPWRRRPLRGRCAGARARAATAPRHGGAATGPRPAIGPFNWGFVNGAPKPPAAPQPQPAPGGAPQAAAEGAGRGPRGQVRRLGGGRRAVRGGYGVVWR